MTMRKTMLVAAVFMGLTTSQAAEAQVLPIVAGGLLGGLAGSIYVNGLGATATGVTTATGSTVAVVPAAATALGGVIAAASAPVVLGVIVGGALGYLWVSYGE